MKGFLQNLMASALARFLFGGLFHAGITATVVFGVMNLSLGSQNERITDVVNSMNRVDDKLEVMRVDNRNLHQVSQGLMNENYRKTVDHSAELKSLRTELATSFKLLSDSIAKIDPTAGEKLHSWGNLYMAGLLEGSDPTEPMPENLSLIGKMEVQARLNAGGFPVGPPNGHFNRKTRVQIVNYQLERDIEPTGVVDGTTKFRLLLETADADIWHEIAASISHAEELCPGCVDESEATYVWKLEADPGKPSITNSMFLEPNLNEFRPPIKHSGSE